MRYSVTLLLAGRRGRRPLRVLAFPPLIADVAFLVGRWLAAAESKDVLSYKRREPASPKAKQMKFPRWLNTIDLLRKLPKTSGERVHPKQRCTPALRVGALFRHLANRARYSAGVMPKRRRKAAQKWLLLSYPTALPTAPTARSVHCSSSHALASRKRIRYSCGV